MARFADQSIRKYLTELASDRPVPGGGSAAALAGALGAALALMVARLSARRQKTERDRSRLRKLTRALEKLVPQFARIIDEDPRIFAKVAQCYAAQRKAASEGKKRAARILTDEVLARAFQIQASLALLGVMTLRVGKDLERLSAGSIKNDLAVSRYLLEAAFEGALATCGINLKYLEDTKRRRLLAREMAQLKREFRKVAVV